ncbi:hypothetical protein [Clostridium sp. CF012]|uniref:hypothetical protein n=1 Tax=Clostridium sp. CF012 TaxID=2843319 RepID=UPI001C0C8C27|nr:hypothetical protein [Clostridium sp. CF012]MBU3142821.1 hypothetical protein [Clostridium sp. CF012]
MIKDLIRELKTVDKNIWGLYTFKRDPLCSKVTGKEKDDMIKKANECGRLEAIDLKEKYGTKNCRQYAQQLGLIISEIEETNANDYILFAKFNSPNKISININNIKKAEEIVEKENLNLLIDEVKIEAILIAHEMFHFIEGKNKEIYTNSTKIRLWKLGPIKYNSGLIALGEIAAMAFAKELLQISYYPNLFDILLLYPHDEKRAKMLYDEVLAMKGSDNNV